VIMVRVSAKILVVLCSTSSGYGVGAFTPSSSAVQPTFAASSRRARRTLLMAETDQAQGKTRAQIAFDKGTGRFSELDEDCIPTDEYCATDKDTGKLIRLTVQEKERMFMDSLQSYYFSGRQLLDDTEFDLLKEDLQWSGSNLIQMNRKEARFLGAMQSYNKGEPMMSDEEYNSLKQELKTEKSKFAVSTEPKCFIDTGICTVTLKEDSFRTNLLSLPALTILYFVWIFLSFEIFHINPLFLTVLGAYPIYKGSNYITNELVFQNGKIVYGSCPSCEAESRVYFGDILGVEGFGEEADMKCTKCKEKFKVLRSTLRASTLPKV